MATLLSDDFNRANSTTVVGSPAIGPAPVIASGVCGISTNQFYASTATGLCTYDLATPNVDITIVANALSASNYTGVVLGYVSATDFWAIGLNTDTAQLLRGTPGGVAIINTMARPTLTTASQLRVSYKDQIIQAWVNGVLTFHHLLDSPITATKHGLRHTNISARVDSILAVDSTSPTLDFDGSVPSNALELVQTEAFFAPAFAYQGHDTKLQDLAAGS